MSLVEQHKVTTMEDAMAHAEGYMLLEEDKNVQIRRRFVIAIPDTRTGSDQSLRQQKCIALVSFHYPNEGRDGKFF